MFAILLNLFVIRNFKGTLFICRNSGVDSQKKLESPCAKEYNVWYRSLSIITS